MRDCDRGRPTTCPRPRKCPHLFRQIIVHNNHTKVPTPNAQTPPLARIPLLDHPHLRAPGIDARNGRPRLAAPVVRQARPVVDDQGRPSPLRLLWVRVPYILLCVVAVAVVWMWIRLGWAHIRVCQSSDPSGYGVTSFAALVPTAAMVCVMAPLALAYGVARLTHGDKARPPPPPPARHPLRTGTSPTGPPRSLAR